MSDATELVVPRDRAHLIELIREAHDPLEATLGRVSDEQMVAPLLDGGWSIKDLLAHITSWEQSTLYNVRESVFGEAPPPLDFPDSGNTDALNAYFYEMHKDLSLAQVRDDFARVHAELLSVLEHVPEDKLSVEIRGRPPYWEIAGDTYLHYPEHRAQVEAVLARSA
ncbi:MAG: DinB family protein [Chloroflexia bacterium]